MDLLTPDIHDLTRQIARLEGEITTVRAETNAMESRIDARLAGMEAVAAKRETRMLLAVSGATIQLRNVVLMWGFVDIWWSCMGLVFNL